MLVALKLIGQNPGMPWLWTTCPLWLIPVLAVIMPDPNKRGLEQRELAERLRKTEAELSLTQAIADRLGRQLADIEEAMTEVRMPFKALPPAQRIRKLDFFAWWEQHGGA